MCEITPLLVQGPTECKNSEWSYSTCLCRTFWMHRVLCLVARQPKDDEMMRLPKAIEQQQHAFAALVDGAFHSAKISYVLLLIKRTISGQNLNETQPIVNEVNFTRRIDAFFPAIRKRINNRLNKGSGCRRIPWCLLSESVEEIWALAFWVVLLSPSRRKQNWRLR